MKRNRKAGTEAARPENSPTGKVSEGAASPDTAARATMDEASTGPHALPSPQTGGGEPTPPPVPASPGGSATGAGQFDAPPPQGAPIRPRRLAWGLAVVVALGLVVWLLSQVRSVSVPLLIAFIIAYLLDPVVDRFENRGIKRTPAIIILLGVFLITMTLVVVVVGPQLVAELATVPSKLQSLFAQIGPWVERTFDYQLPTTVAGAVERIQMEMGGFDLAKFVAPAGDVARVVFGGTATALGALAGVVMIPVFAFFLLRDFDLLTAQVRDLLPARHREGIVARFREIDTAMGSFIRGQLTVAAILAVLYSAGLAIIGLPLALVVGVVSGLGNMVPYLGTTLGLVLATLMALLDWQGVVHLILVYGVFVVVQGLEGWVITPKIVGESVGLSPFWVIVAVLVFGDLFGFLGILIAVPLAAILKILLRVAIEAYRASPLFEEA